VIKGEAIQKRIVSRRAALRVRRRRRNQEHQANDDRYKGRGCSVFISYLYMRERLGAAPKHSPAYPSACRLLQQFHPSFWFPQHARVAASLHGAGGAAGLSSAVVTGGHLLSFVAYRRQTYCPAHGRSGRIARCSPAIWRRQTRLTRCTSVARRGSRDRSCGAPARRHTTASVLFGN
jgi:hypothetical protein